MPVPTAAEISDQLFRAAEGRAAQHNLTFKSGAASQLRAMADKGASTILMAAQTKSPGVQEQYVRGVMRVAIEAMTTVVDEMTSARHRLPGYVVANQNLLGEQTLQSARDILCPIWPIC